MNKRFFIIFFLSFLSLTSLIFSQNIDIRLLRSLNSSNPLPSDKIFQFVSNSDVYLVLGIPAGIATAGLLKNDKELVRNACVIIAAAAIASGVTTALKYSVKRDRPFITYPDITKKSSAGSPSFPSGHTSG